MEDSGLQVRGVQLVNTSAGPQTKPTLSARDSVTLCAPKVARQ